MTVRKIAKTSTRNIPIRGTVRKVRTVTLYENDGGGLSMHAHKGRYLYIGLEEALQWGDANFAEDAKAHSVGDTGDWIVSVLRWADVMDKYEPEDHLPVGIDSIATYKAGKVTLIGDPGLYARQYLGLPEDYDYPGYGTVLCPGPVIVQFRESDLSDRGKLLVDAYRKHNVWLIEAQGDVASVTLSLTGYESFDNECDIDEDTRLCVPLDDLLVPGGRERLFGVDDLNHNDQSGQMGICASIPTEEYLQGLIENLGTRPIGETWFVPFEIVEQIQRGELEGAQAINAAGEALCKYCESSCFRVSGDRSDQCPIQQTVWDKVYPFLQEGIAYRILQK